MTINKTPTYENINASIPKSIRDIVQEKADELGIPFHLMAGRFILIGVEADMTNDSRASGKCCNS